MSLMDNANQDIVDQAENLSYPPSGGRVKLIVFGVLLPLFLFYEAYDSLSVEDLKSPVVDFIFLASLTKAACVKNASIGLFCHIRWFWGLLGYHHVFEVGTAISLFCFIASLIAYYFHQFA